LPEFSIAAASSTAETWIYTLRIYGR